MSTLVKICGLRTVEAVNAAVRAGADALGFVFAESPRRITPTEAAAICAAVPAGVIRVAVMRHPTAAEWDEVYSVFRPDWLQTEAADLAGIAIPGDVRAMPVFRDRADLDEAALAVPDAALFESGASGIGQRADWNRAARLARRTQLMLAGGLNPGNVAAAIRQVRPWGVDVSSGVEHRRGEKDLERIAAFVSAVRQLESKHAD